MKNSHKNISLETKEKMGKARRGKAPWNKNKRGLQKHTEETKKILRNKNLGKNNHFYGKKHSAESLLEMSNSKKEEKNPMYKKIPWNKGLKINSLT